MGFLEITHLKKKKKINFNNHIKTNVIAQCITIFSEHQKRKKPPIQLKPLTALFLEKLHTFKKKKKKKPHISVKFQDHRKVSVYEYREREKERERCIYMARAFEVSGIGLDELVGGHVFHISRSLHFLLLLGLAAASAAACLLQLYKM